ncbi:phosphate/phosphite/phosphonate ABC transporter substrate-binding protein [Psychrobacillus soli]|uniref:Phosphate/phosphite/phosphonate ABC transporter substrate-binding protein n=1 Tax=Psychrobacillus soli TaxID=1543965 RepID=A0A544TCZ5_9BACI|nr:phosphate/phosphite/phosphonate ABC transporter substrate-binding protein [Psychrobacillus soli]TQR15337.1 phosphate/phosphite/phosphonate ABC transporter substrate-binding protein [Psychrobacillus soli]
MNSRKFVCLLSIFLVSLLLTSCATTPKKLTIGMIPVKDAIEMEKEFEPIRLYLEEQLGMPIEVDTADSYVSLIEEMKNETIDIGWYGAFSYIAAESEMELTPLVVQQRKDTGIYYNSLIITPKNSGISTIEELEGKKFAFVDSGSTSGFVLPYALLKSRNIAYETFFSEIEYAGSHDQVLANILHHEVDAGAISSVQYGNLIEKGIVKPDDMTVIWKSENIPGSPYVARSELDEEIQEGFTEAMLALHTKEPDVLNSYDNTVEKYIEVDKKYYNPIKNIATILGKEYMYEYFLKGE